jgi:hypothetical protein
MASLVNPSNINGNFPIAGQDNDSQGFRDNFTNIRNNFTFIKAEVEDLQAKAILKSALIGTTLNNDFQGSKVKNLQVSNLTETVKDLGTFAGGQLEIDLAEGNIIKLIAPTTGDITIADVIKNWPSSLQHARILLYIEVPATTVTLTLPASWTTDLSSVPGLRRVDGDAVINFSDPGDYIYEITSPDSGTTVFFRELTTGNAVFRDPNFYMVGYGVGASDDVPLRTGYESPTLMIGFGQYLGDPTTNVGVGYLIDALKDGGDTLMVKGSVTSYQSHQDDQANLTSGVDSLTSAGFSVVKDRTYISTGLVSLGNIVAGDLVGYYNAIGYTYDNLGATSLSYQQLGTVQFVAEGTTNSPFGVGGKILIKTKGDGTADNLMPNATVGAYNYVTTRGGLRTAIEIDNKQNVTIYGNLSVIGETTVVESTVVSVEDKSLILGNNGTETTNQGAGIFVFSNAADGGANISLNNTGWLTNRSFTIANTSPANALIVNGNTRVGGNLYVEGSMTVANIIYQNIEITTSTETVQGQLSVANSVAATSTTTGAIVTTGGVGIANGLYVNGTTYAQNFSTANALITGGSAYDLTHLAATGGHVLTFNAANFTSANMWITGGVIGVSPVTGQVIPASNVYAITSYFDNFSSPNVVITGGSISGASISGITLTELANTQLSNSWITSGAIGMQPDGTTSPVANVYATTAQFTNFSTANAVITGGSATDLTATTLVADNFSTANAKITGGNIVLSAGTATVAPLQFTTGVNTTAVASGAVEYDGSGLYFTNSNTAVGRQQIESGHIFVSNANIAFNNGTAPAINTGYCLFGGPIAQNSWIGNIQVAANMVYEVDIKATIFHAATPTTSIQYVTFSSGTGTCTVTNFSYDVTWSPAAGGALNGASFSGLGASGAAIAFPALSAVSAVNGTHVSPQYTFRIKGIIRTQNAGNLVPMIMYSAAPGQVTSLSAGSYYRVTPVGVNAGTRGNIVVGSYNSVLTG